jgi:hypothetical protein
MELAEVMVSDSSRISGSSRWINRYATRCSRPRYRARITNDFELGIRCQQIGKAATNDFMVIDQENPNHCESFLLTGRGKNHGTLIQYPTSS